MATLNFIRGIGRWLGVALLLAAAAAQADTCPFDNGAATLENDGLVLTRYALGLRGAPLVANTAFAATDAATIESNVNCPSCGLNVTGGSAFSVADATIISRKIAGLSGAALTNGVALGSGTRNTVAAVNSFLLAGCGGASNAWVLGGNNVGTGSSIIGTLDARPLRITSGDSMQIIARDTFIAQVIAPGNIASGVTYMTAAGESGSTMTAPNIRSGSVANFISANSYGSTIGGGGLFESVCFNPKTLTYGADCGNSITGSGYASIGGGRGNAVESGSGAATIAGGRDNRINATGSAVISGGYGNTVNADNATVAGGFGNTAGSSTTRTGQFSFIAGGTENYTQGRASFAAGQRAKAYHDHSFVWGGSSTVDTNSAGLDTFVVYAPGSINMYAGPVGAGGCILSAGASGWACSSDQNLKTHIKSLNVRDVLRRVVAMPVASWSFKAADAYKHIGPMAQDFAKAFGLGGDDTTISPMDSAGVALAAIQGLNQIVKEKDAKIDALRRAHNALQQKIAAIEKRLSSSAQSLK